MLNQSEYRWHMTWKSKEEMTSKKLKQEWKASTRKRNLE